MMTESRLVGLRLIALCALPLASSGLAGCASSTASAPPAEAAAEPSAIVAERGIADLFPKTRSHVKGTLVFRDSPDGLSIKGKLKDLESGSYAITLHESGDCSAHDAKTVGAVWNPTASQPPLGFLGNATGSDEAREGTVELVAPGLTLNGETSVLGHALVVHAWPMDPAADLGKVPFLACGVIEAGAD
jgi:Cu-Zn family superoxide dismutase